SSFPARVLRKPPSTRLPVSTTPAALSCPPDSAGVPATHETEARAIHRIKTVFIMYKILRITAASNAIFAVPRVYYYPKKQRFGHKRFNYFSERSTIKKLDK